MRVRDIITENDKFDVGAGAAALADRIMAGANLIDRGVEQYNNEIRDQKRKPKKKQKNCLLKEKLK